MSDWTSYNTAAESHARLAVPSYFEQPARDLIARMDIATATRILDIGTGSGVAAIRAAAVSPQAFVVGIDPSLEMLRIARNRGLRQAAMAVIPYLPFPSRAFDRVLAGFVLSHIPLYEAGLLEIAGVIASGGRFGATTWGPVESEYRQFWQTLAESFIGKQPLADATRKALPWEEWFTEPDHLAEAFEAAGFGNFQVDHVFYTVQTSIADFLAIRENSIAARFIRQNVDAPQWERFKETVAGEFHRRFKDPVEFTRDVYIAIGTRP